MIRTIRHPAVTLVVLLATVAACVSDPLSPGSFGVLSAAAGDGQIGPVNATLPMPLRVVARDASGAAISGLEVAWEITGVSGPGSDISATTTTTDAAGSASVSFTLGSVPGGYSVRATADGGAAEFTLFARRSAGGAAVQSGAGQVGLTGATLPEPLVFALTAGGQPAPGVEIRFSVAEGEGASVSPATAVTGPEGLAQTVLTLGPSNGRVRVSATDGSSAAVFVNFACGGDTAADQVSLAVGGSATISGTDVGCIQFGAQAAGASYAAVVTPLDRTLSFHDVSLYLRGAPASATAVVAPAGELRAGSPGGTHAGALGRRNRAAQYALDQSLRELEAPLLSAIRERATRGGFSLQEVPAVGDTLSFGFSCVSPAVFPGTPDTITGVVREVSRRGVVVEDTTITARFTAQEAADIGAMFDDVIYATDSTYFGAPADIDANGGRVVLLFTAGVNAMSDVNPNGYDDGIVAGFFCPTDLGLAGGNTAEMFYLVSPDPAGAFTQASDVGLSKEELLSFVNGTIAHEFQHLINAQRGGGGAFDIWLNEGLSHLAEEVVGHTATGLAPGQELSLSDYDGVAGGLAAFNTYHIGNWFNLLTYLAAPQDTAGLVMSRDPLGPSTFRLRGTAWSFVRYLLDRFEGPATEATATRSLVLDGSGNARDAVTAVFGVPFEQLAADWEAMLAVEDLGLATGAALDLPSYRLRQMYRELGDRSLAFPAGVFPLASTGFGLAGDADAGDALFTATGWYLDLTAPAGSAATGIRFGLPGTAEDLSASADVRVVIVRTN